MKSARPSKQALYVASAVLFAAAATLTVAWTGSMSAMGAMPMPGGWTMSTAWMPMCGQTWARAAASFGGMWVVMMTAMMLPSMVPMLSRYQDAVIATRESRVSGLTVLAAGAYLAVWTLVGLCVFTLGAAVAAVEMRWPVVSRAVPLAVGAIVVIAGAMQFTPWKARQLACCRGAAYSAYHLADDIGTALRHGVRLGLHCNACCAGLTAVLIAIGVMDVRAMAVVGVAITAERLAPEGLRVARVIGSVVVGAGLILIVRAV